MKQLHGLAPRVYYLVSRVRPQDYKANPQRGIAVISFAHQTRNIKHIQHSNPIVTVTYAYWHASVKHAVVRRRRFTEKFACSREKI